MLIRKQLPVTLILTTVLLSLVVVLPRAAASLAEFQSYLPVVIRQSNFQESRGILDTNFADDGLVTTDFNGASDLASALAIQPDGKIVVAGDAYNGTNDDFALARYNPDGSLDTTFGTDGKVTTDFGSNSDKGYGMALQADGKIVVSGYTYIGANHDFALARYNPDGSLDTSFDGDGLVTTDFGNSDFGVGVVVQPDSKIVVAGIAHNGTDRDFGLARYNPDGSLDTSFDGDGMLMTDFYGGNDFGYAITLQEDGKIVVAGSAPNGAAHDFALARYNPDGSLDTTFGGDGRVSTDFGGGDDTAFALALLPDGGIVAVGTSDNTFSDFAIACYNPDGSLDIGFDGDGLATIDFFGYWDDGSAVAVQPDGKIILVGYAYDNGSQDFALVRLHPDGSLDTTFDGDGMLTTDFNGNNDNAGAVVLQPDGKIVVAGGAVIDSSYDFALARYK